MTRFYRGALRLLPKDVRERHGAEMTAVFDQQVDEARRRGGTGALPCLFARELAALARFAWRELQESTSGGDRPESRIALISVIPAKSS